MRLRELQIEDAPYMLEWMHDANVSSGFYVDFSTKTLDDCKNFIVDVQTNCVHLAVADDDNQYMGTVSLKNIENKFYSAEFAIAMRTCAMGSGLSSFAINEVMRIAKEKYGLKYVYWNVKKSNTRAIRFYDKNKFNRVDESKIFMIDMQSIQNRNELFWYLNVL